MTEEIQSDSFLGPIEHFTITIYLINYLEMTVSFALRPY